MPTPLILQSIHLRKLDGGVSITGSHNPAEYNGIKFIFKTHTFLGNSEIKEILPYFKGKKKFVENTKSVMEIQAVYVKDNPMVLP